MKQVPATFACSTASDCSMTCGIADHPLEAYYRTLLESLKDLVKELRLVQATGNSLFAVSRIGSQVRALNSDMAWFCLPPSAIVGRLQSDCVPPILAT